jgi:hypothetical protein
MERKNVGAVIGNRQLAQSPSRGGCNYTPQPAIAEPVKEKSADELEAEKLGVSVSKLIAMRRYARQLRGMYPKMNVNKIQSKVALKFNIKLKK